LPVTLIMTRRREPTPSPDRPDGDSCPLPAASRELPHTLASVVAPKPRRTILGALGIADLDHLLSREGMTAPVGPGGGNRRAGIQLVAAMKIEEVLEGGIADKAGLKAGDVIVKVGDKPVANRVEFVAALRTPAREVSIVIRRDGQEIGRKLTFLAAARP